MRPPGSSRPPLAHPVSEARRVLFVRTDRLGETLLNLPAVATLRAALPQASLSLLVNPELQALLSRVQGVDRVLTDAPSAGRAWWVRAVTLGRTLRAERFDAAFVSNPRKDLHVAVWLAGIPCRVGYDRKWGRLLTCRLPDRKALGDRPEVEYNLDLVRAVGLPTPVLQWQLPRFERERVDVDQLLAQQGIAPGQPLLAVHPWTSNPVKQWPAERFRVLMERAVQRLPVRVVIVGGREERDQAGAVLPPGVPIADLVGRVTLLQLAALLQRARLLVSNDSGPVHLAAAVGTKTLVLFGTPTPSGGPQRWGPWGEGHVVIWKPSMEAITVDEVWRALEEQLRGRA